jgi:hypothetical protein
MQKELQHNPHYDWGAVHHCDMGTPQNPGVLLCAHYVHSHLALDKRRTNSASHLIKYMLCDLGQTPCCSATSTYIYTVNMTAATDFTFSSTVPHTPADPI